MARMKAKTQCLHTSRFFIRFFIRVIRGDAFLANITDCESAPSSASPVYGEVPSEGSLGWHFLEKVSLFEWLACLLADELDQGG